VEGKKNGQEKRRVWRKLHLALEAGTHEAICVCLSLNKVTDTEAFRDLSTRHTRKSWSLQPTEFMAADGATTNCGVIKSRDLSRREPGVLLAG